MATSAAPSLVPRDGGVPNALIVFEHRNARGPMRLLRSGFRHCFCVVGRGDSWIVCDPLKGSIVLKAVVGHPVEALAAHFACGGRRVLWGVAAPFPTERLRVRPVTCVEIVKRLIGLDGPGIFTPYQLFRFLQGARSGLDFRAFEPAPEEHNFCLDSELK